jgi:hypothetical protein
MRKLFFIIFIIILSSCKEKNEIDFSISEVGPISIYTEAKANSNIKNNDIVILFSGGFGGMPNFKNEKDSIFQKKYNVKFLSEGCLRTSTFEDEIIYNETIFKHLDSLYNKGWRNEIKKGAIGFKQT